MDASNAQCHKRTTTEKVSVALIFHGFANIWHCHRMRSHPEESYRSAEWPANAAEGLHFVGMMGRGHLLKKQVCVSTVQNKAGGPWCTSFHLCKALLLLGPVASKVRQTETCLYVLRSAVLHNPWAKFVPSADINHWSTEWITTVLISPSKPLALLPLPPTSHLL